MVVLALIVLQSVLLSSCGFKISSFHSASLLSLPISDSNNNNNIYKYKYDNNYCNKLMTLNVKNKIDIDSVSTSSYKADVQRTSLWGIAH